jgi:hypothetical protein
MAQRVTRISLASLLALALVAPSPVAMACGPDFTPPILIESSYPDLSADAYAAGQLGVVLPTYEPAYLVVAYRYFSGKPLSAVEQKQFVGPCDYHPGCEDQDRANSGMSDWNAASQGTTNFASPDKVSSFLPGVVYSAGPNAPFESYPNCLDDAFRTAAATLEARKEKFGEQSAAVASWLGAQETVFDNCNGPSAHAQIPTAADAGLPLEIRQDRDYQIAAAYFYAENWDEAEKRFLKIADDPSSPWRAMSGLVAARCEIRKATLGTDDPVETQKDFEAADAQLRKIIADPAFASVKAGAERLRGFVEYRSEPDARFIELGRSLAHGTSPDTFSQDVEDYSQLLRQRSWRFKKSPPDPDKDTMTDWVMSFDSSDRRPDAEALRIARWQQTGALPWLVAALTYADQDTPQVSDLIDAAEKIPAISPAHLTVDFQKDRLYAATGKEDAARQDIGKVLAMPQDRLPLSSRNLFLALGMKLAQHLNEFLGDAPRMPAAPSADNWMESPNLEPMFDVDASATLTEAMPLSVQMDAVESTILPRPLRKEVAIAAWTRAIVLHNDAAARGLAPFVTELAPELKQEFEPYLSAKDGDSREFAGVFLILHTPGMRPFVGTGYSRTTWNNPEDLDALDNWHDNWWCNAQPLPRGNPNNVRPYQQFTPDFTESMYEVYPDGKISPPEFLDQAQRDAAQREWAALTALPAGPDWLAEQAVEWAKAHPDDPRVPEALSLAVRATRYGCTDADTGKYSKAAFTLLHTRYPKSEWAARTDYWFK